MSKDLKLALEIAAKATGREELAELVKDVSSIGPVSSEVEAEAKRLADQLQELARQRDLIDAVNKSKEALTNLEQAALLSKDKLERLRQEQAQAGGDAQGMADKERLLASEVKQLESQLVKQATTHTKLTAALKQSGIDTSNLGSEQNRLQNELQQTAAKTEGLAGSLGSMKAGAASLATGIGSLTTKLFAMAGAYVGIGALKNALVSMFESGNRAEQLSIQMTTVMGSIQGGEQATAWIKDFAKNTPLQLNEVTETFIRLKAMGLDPMDGTMQAVVDQSAKLGIGFEGVQSISLALGQAWAKGKLQGEEMMQMQERGVSVQDLLAKALGKTTAEIADMSSKGLLGRDAIKALIAEMGSESAGAANAQMGTLTGLLSNLGDTWESFKVSVANSGALEWLKSQLKELSDTINAMAADGRLKQYAQQISDWFVTTAQSTKDFIMDIGGSFDGLLSAVNVTVQSLRVVFNSFTGAVKGFAAASIAPLYGVLSSLEKVARALGQEGLAKQIGYAAGMMKAQMDAFADGAKGDLDDIVDAANRMSSGHTKATDAVVKSLQGAEQQSAQSSAEIVRHQNAITDASTKAAEAMTNALKGIGLDYDQLEGKVGSSFKGVKDAMDQLMSSTAVSAETIKAVLDKGFSSAKNKAELDVLNQGIKQLHEQGKLIGPAYASSMDMAANATKKMTAETAASSQAYQDLGIKSSSALEAIAAKNKAAYDQIKLTNASLATQQQAFAVYAESELKAAQASGRYADASLAAQAAALDMTTQLDALVKTIDQTGGSAVLAGSSLNTLQTMLNDTATAAKSAGAELSAIEQAQKSVAEGAQAAATYIADYGNALSAQLKEMSAGTELYYQQLMGTTRATSSMTSELDQLNAKLDTNAQQWRRISAGITLDDIQGHIKDMGLAYLAAERAFLQQDAAVVKMTNRLQDANGVSARTLSQAEGLLKSSRLLGDEQLSGLRTALDDVRSKMAQVKGEADSTLKSLQNELDNLNGNKMAIELRDYQTRVADINSQLAKAQAQGNKAAQDSLRESLRLANEIHKQNMANIKAETEAKQASAKTPTTAANNTSSAATATPLTREITINLGSSRSTIKTDAAGEASLEAMLRQLESLGAINK